MTETSTGAAGFARRLWEARRGGYRIRVEEGERPADEAEAYAVQRGITEISGCEVAGFKIGATAQAAMDVLGVDGPFFGPLYRETFHHDGAAIRLPMAHTPGVEAEFVVGLASDLPPRAAGWALEEVRRAVAWVAPGLEIVGARLEGGLAGAGVLAIADGAANIDFVLGPTDGDWRGADLSSHPVVLRVNGAEAASGNSRMLVFGDPVAGVAWLANRPEVAPRGLRVGDAITTGTCTGIRPLSPGDEVVADYGSLGAVSARFEA